MSATDVVDEYHEQIRGILDRRLTLCRDSVKVAGVVRGVRFEGWVPLASLRAKPNRSWIRSKHYHWALAVLCILGPFILLPFAVSPPNYILLIFGLVLYVPASWYFACALERKEVALFLNDSGVVVLDLWRNGPDAARFPEFVAAIEKQISEQSRNGSG